MLLNLVACAITMALNPGVPGVQTSKPAQVHQSFEGKIVRTVKLDYLLYLPKEYKESKSKHWPLLLFLHGSGERGADLDKVKMHGPPKLVEQGKEFPFIIVSPQCPEEVWWDTDTLNALLDSIIKKYRVDEDRVYCTGLSMGGFGTWSLAAAYPDRFAAIAPICGGGEPRNASKIKDIPAWVFHGAKDPVVNIAQDQAMVDALKAAGGTVKFTIYPDAEHDSWTQTYENQALFDWLLEQHRTKKTAGDIKH